MKRQTFGSGILAGAMGVLALTAGSGMARADDPANPVGPASPIIDNVLTETPDTFVDTHDEGRPSKAWGGTGMYCENTYVRCH
ncbi:hypothetical protein [Mycobacterium sp. Marseille-P9652]|uniref:hypothetical protein n=1 Tax=Mycobacterium sp. Marseille-P9652 TaxID=2654950 RepID=UPI0012E84AB3|nr:hypothetical protein [Mycobacterium sp. Marseille-P9652]